MEYLSRTEMQAPMLKTYSSRGSAVILIINITRSAFMAHRCGLLHSPNI